jgi:hypothetical protein
MRSIEVDTDAGTATVSRRDQTQAVLAGFGDSTVPRLHTVE